MGTGQYFPPAPDTDTVMAFDTSCGLRWQTTLDGYTNSSPALADVTGNGTLDVVEGTQAPTGGGSVWVLNGSTGSPMWHAGTTGAVLGSVVTADLTGRATRTCWCPPSRGWTSSTGARTSGSWSSTGRQQQDIRRARLPELAAGHRRPQRHRRHHRGRLRLP